MEILKWFVKVILCNFQENNTYDNVHDKTWIKKWQLTKLDVGQVCLIKYIACSINGSIVH